VFIFAAFLSLVASEFAARVLHLSKTCNSYTGLIRAEGKAAYSPKKNSYGWRDREFARTKELNTIRIACIGDSVTEGYRVELKDTFPKVLEDKLLGMNYDVEVINAGVSGNNTSKNLSTLKAIVQFNPDLIIYQFGLNDIEGYEHMESISIKASTNFYNKPKKHFDLKAILRKSVLYLALAERYNYLKLKSGYKNWAFNEWDIKDALWEKEFIKLKEGFIEAYNHSEILIIYIPYDFQIYSSKEETLIPSKKLNKFCQDNGYYFIDFTKIFKTQKNKYNIFLDDCHLSNYGNQIVAFYLENFILKNNNLLQRK